ncbi:hypothetical protein D3C78_1173800 [compost metagenome]
MQTLAVRRERGDICRIAAAIGSILSSIGAVGAPTMISVSSWSTTCKASVATCSPLEAPINPPSSEATVNR